MASAIRLLEDNGLDGLDVDYEYPQNDEQARGYVALLKEMREGLDAHATRKRINYKYLLTVSHKLRTGCSLFMKVSDCSALRTRQLSEATRSGDGPLS